MSYTEQITRPLTPKATPPYHSRVGVVVDAELRGYFSRWTCWTASAAALFVLSCVIVDAFLVRNATAHTVAAHFTWILLLALVPAMLSDEGRKKGTLEPLLATGVKRGDIVIGRFLTATMLYFLGVTLLVIITFQRSSGIALLPSNALFVPSTEFLDSFHPSIASAIAVIGVLTAGGLPCIALTLNFSDANLERDSWAFWLYLIVVFVRPMLESITGLKLIKVAEFLVNVPETLQWVFTRFSYGPHAPHAASQLPYFVILNMAWWSVLTVIFLALATRNLEPR